jgi:ABC-2 type transport system permease protein
MFNIIKADFYKFFKSKTFYVSLIVALLFATLYVVATYFGVQQMGQPGGPPVGAIETNTRGLLFRAIDSNIVIMLIAVMTSIFVSAEYSTGIIKDTVSSGKSRTKIFLSKLIVTAVGASLILVFNVIYQTLFGLLFLEYGTAFNMVEFWLVLKTLFSALVVIISFNTLFATLTTAFKTLGASLASNIGLLMFGGLIFYLISLIGDFFKNITDYWLADNLTKIVQNAMLNSYEFKPLIIALCYLIVSVIAGILIFKKQDIK